MSAMKPIVWGMLILLSIFWGGSFFFVEIALRDFQPFTLVFIRVALAAVILLGVVYVRKEKMPASLRGWGSLFIMGALNNAIPFSLIVWGQKSIESGVASILCATVPIFTIVLAHFMTSDERITVKKLAGILLGFLGVYIMLSPELKNGLNWRGLGLIAVIAAALSYSLAVIYGKRFKKTSPYVNSAGMLIGSAAMMLPLVLIVDKPWSLSPSLSPVLAVSALAVLSTALAYVLYFKVLAAAGATNLTLVTFLMPVGALALGAGVLGEVIRSWEIIGMVFIFMGLMVLDGRVIIWFKNRLKPLKVNEEYK